MIRILAWVLLVAACLSMVALFVGLLPPYTYAEYIPITLGGLGVAAILIHDSRKDSRDG